MAQHSSKETLGLIKEAKQGSQSSFTHLLDIYWQEVYHFILKRTENETDAEDITIETFAKAFDKIGTYKEEFAFNTWLIAIAKNVHTDLIRKKKISETVDFAENEEYWSLNITDEDTLEDQLIYEQNLATLKRCIKQLKPHYQQVIQLRYFQERSYKEIAEIINEPLNNVKIKILRAKKLLTELISSCQ